MSEEVSDNEKAFELLSQHNDALMLQIALYEETLRGYNLRGLLWAVIKERVLAFIGRK